MGKRWGMYCAALVGFALAGCSTYRDLRDWWTDDTASPTEEEWAAYREFYRNENAPPPAAEPPKVAEVTVPPLTEPIQRSLLPRPEAPSRRQKPPAVERPSVAPPPPPSPAEERAVTETAAIAEVPILPPSLASVAGMSEARLREELGAPTTATERGAQKIWRYAGNGCSVEVIFFRDVTRNTYAALQQRTFGSDNTVSTAPCLRSVRQGS